MNNTQEFGNFHPSSMADFVASDWGECLGLYGKPGSGKTTLAATADESEYGSPVLFLDAEGGTNILPKRKSIYVIGKKEGLIGWGSMQRFCGFCKSLPEIPWKTIVLDNFCEMAKWEMALHVPPGTPPQLQHYGENTLKMIQFAVFWRDFSRERGVNVIINLWDETDKSDATGRWETHFALTPKLANALPGYFDTIGYLTVDEKQVRSLRLAPSVNLSTKFRKPPDGNAAKIPSIIFNPHLGHVLDTLKGGSPWPVAAHQGGNTQEAKPTQPEPETNESTS